MTDLQNKLKPPYFKNKLSMQFNIIPIVPANTPKTPYNKQTTNIMHNQKRDKPIPNNTLSPVTQLISRPKLPIYNQYNGVILSLSTTMNRIDSFFNIIDNIESIDRVFKVIINLCKVYKRFKIEISDNQLNSVKKHPIILRLNAKHGYEKYVVHVVNDFGPITKLTGVYEYCANNQYSESTFVIMDDDTEYLDNCLTEIVQYKTPNNIISCSGFLFYETMEYTRIDETGNKKGKLNHADIIEGFSGICFQYADIDLKLFRFLQYYQTIDWDTKIDETNEYMYRVNTLLKACFLGDDLLISYYFRKKKQLYKVFGYLESIKQQEYGYGTDALHQNTVFQSNNGSYAYVMRNVDIYELIILHIDLCDHIKHLGRFAVKPRRN